MSGPEPGGSPTPEAPQPSAWQAPPPGPAKAAGPAPGVAYADLGIRIGAYIIDVIVQVILISGAVGAILSVIFIIAFEAAFSAIYFIYSWTSLRASPGQKALGLETVNAADGRTVTQPQAIRRWLFLFGPFILLSALQLVVGSALGGLFGLISFGYFVYLLYTTYQDPKRQGYHDHQADTVVVKRTVA